MAAFVWFEGCDGEVLDKTYQGWTDISSVSFSCEKPGEGLTGQSRRRGDVKLNDITITKELDSSSNALCTNICKGIVFTKVKIHLTASYTAKGDVGGRLPYLEYELDNVAVSSFSSSGDGEEPPQEEFSLNYEKIKCKYTKRDQEGGNVAELVWGWDVEKSQEYV